MEVRDRMEQDEEYWSKGVLTKNPEVIRVLSFGVCWFERLLGI